jgi:alkylation response protein AidB-like acyl-CoA dehydrogenase
MSAPRTDLLLTPELREPVTAFFEARAAAVDAGQATVQEGLRYLHEHVFAIPADGESPNADLGRVIEVMATVAWSDLSSAFSLWCHRMVLEYLSYAPPGSFLRDEVLPKVLRCELLGTTALAPAMAYFVNQAPLPITARPVDGALVLKGRVNWASNLFPPDFLMVTAAAEEKSECALIVAVPGSAHGIRVDPYPRLLALQATGSSSLQLEEVEIGPEWLITNDLSAFIRQVRPTFLLLQSAFCWGLASRALAEARPLIRGVNEVLRGDLEELEQRLEELALRVRKAAGDRGRTSPMRELLEIRLGCAQLATAAVALEAKAVGGRSYIHDTPTARRLREAAFLPVQAPTEGQLRWELSRFVS